MKQINSLNIVAKRWFQKSYGNTYHSVAVYVNGQTLYVPFEYGYGDHFLETAKEALIGAGYDVKLDSEHFSTLHLREVLHGTYEVYDVPRKRDL